MRNKEILNKIKKYGKEGYGGKDIFYFMEDELCDTCPMELFSCKCPNKCNEDGDYCYDCIEKHIDLFLADKLEKNLYLVLESNNGDDLYGFSDIVNYCFNENIKIKKFDVSFVRGNETFLVQMDFEFNENKYEDLKLKISQFMSKEHFKTTI